MYYQKEHEVTCIKGQIQDWVKHDNLKLESLQIPSDGRMDTILNWSIQPTKKKKITNTYKGKESTVVLNRCWLSDTMHIKYLHYDS